MPEKLKDTPIFKSEDEEREFWAKKDSTDFIDWKKSEVIVCCISGKQLKNLFTETKLEKNLKVKR